MIEPTSAPSRLASIVAATGEARTRAQISTAAASAPDENVPSCWWSTEAGDRDRHVIERSRLGALIGRHGRDRPVELRELVMPVKVASGVGSLDRDVHGPLVGEEHEVGPADEGQQLAVPAESR